MDSLILVPFGPDRPVPESHRFCNHCGGDGENHIAGGHCPVCRGKGYWNREDIRLYHESAPKVCKSCCGDEHRDPYWMPGEPRLCVFCQEELGASIIHEDCHERMILRANFLLRYPNDFVVLSVLDS